MQTLKSNKPALAALALMVAALLAVSGPAVAQERPTAPPDPQAEAFHARADALVKQMTLEEKIDYIGGSHGFYVREMPKLKLPALKMSDGPLGARNDGPATTFAGGITLAASWDTNLALNIGSGIARDARARGVHFMLGPGVNIYRAPMNGRNFEYMGEDPFLAKQMAVAYIKGMQSEAVSATVKHFMGNNSDFLRHDSNSVIGERAMREIYLPVFEGVVKEAHVGAIMDSYNLINGSHATQNDFINNQVAKKEWKFDGIIMSDWWSTYDGVAAAKGGLDLEMPAGSFMNQKSLLPAVKSGALPESVIDDKVRRIIYTALRFGWLERDQTDLTYPRYSQQGRDVALQAAQEGMVLLKNDGNLLPLDKDKVESILVVGPDAYPFVANGGGSARVQPYAGISFMEGISNFLGKNANVLYSRGLPTYTDIANNTNFMTAAKDGKPGISVEYFDNGDLSGAPVKKEVRQHISLSEPMDFSAFTDEIWATYWTGKATSQRWTGYYKAEKAATYDIFLQGAGEGAGNRLYVDDKLVIDNWDIWRALVGQASVPLSAGPHMIVLQFYQKPGWNGPLARVGIAQQGTLVDPAAKEMAAKADAVVVVAGFDADNESEGSDRTFALPIGQNDLIRAMAAANKKTIVAMISGGGVDATPWLDQVPAMIEAWYPGQEGGRAFADLLFGVVSPSGKLPISWERKWEDNPTAKSYYLKPGTKDVEYTEGIFVGYRGYEHNNVKPLFPFGYGLSYSTFKYSNLEIKSFTKDGGAPFVVNFDITNTGTREATDIAEVYVHDPNPKVPRPVKELKGFVRMQVKPGETRHVGLYLEDRSFTYFDAQSKHWHADTGDYAVLVGHSSADIELTGKANLPKPVDLAP